MSVRTEIQKRVQELVQDGTFRLITYDTAHLPVEEVGTLAPSSVACNEVGAGLSDNAKNGATTSGFVIRDWRFECTAQFTSEVDVSDFMINELRSLNFNTDDLLVNVSPGSYNVEHSPRNASHNGTKLTIGLTANTRR
jgi:hypothetical protein